MQIFINCPFCDHETEIEPHLDTMDIDDMNITGMVRCGEEVGIDEGCGEVYGYKISTKMTIVTLEMKEAKEARVIGGE